MKLKFVYVSAEIIVLHEERNMILCRVIDLKIEGVHHTFVKNRIKINC